MQFKIFNLNTDHISCSLFSNPTTQKVVTELRIQLIRILSTGEQANQRTHNKHNKSSDHGVPQIGNLKQKEGLFSKM